MRYPHSNTDYEATPDGSVRVVDLDRGIEGRFNRDGDWLDGELRWCDPHMARWVADKAGRTPASTRSSAPYRPPTTTDEGTDQ